MAMNKSKKNPLNYKNWLIVCLGFSLIFISVIAMLGETYLGSILTYCSAFLFGSFYFLIYSLIIVFGIFLIIRKKFLPVKGCSLIYIGLLLILFSMLAFGSYSAFSSNSDLTFSSLNHFYFNRMKGFASSIFSIDSYANLGALGGGYIGLFLIVLFGSIWSNIGNAIFFVLLLIFGLFLLCYKPIQQIVNEIKAKKENKVVYSSPYHAQDGKTAETLDRGSISETRDPSLYAPFKNDWKGDVNPNKKVTSTPIVKEVEVEEKKIEVVEKKNVDNSFMFNSIKPIVPTVETKVEPIKQEEINETYTPKVEEKQTESIEDIKPVVSEEIDQEKDEELNRQASAFSSNAKGPDSNTFEVLITPRAVETNNQQTIEENDTTIKNTQAPTQSLPLKRGNPLENVAKNAKPKENKENTFNIAYEEGPTLVEEKEETVVETEEKVELSEEEQMKEIEKKYFKEKQQKAIQALQDKKKAQLEKKARLMRFVSDTPKIYDYDLPTDSLLDEHDDSAKMLVNSESAEDKVQIINNVFKDYNVEAKAISYTIGASVTRFNVETEPGERSERIASLVDELQRALNGDKSVRVETVVEGKSTSGIEVGNAVSMAVSFKDIFENVETNTKDNLLLPIGKDITGNIITYPLNKMPHLLIAGTTGSGKSVLVHSMIMTLIMRNYPSQMKLILIDPKQVEFVHYQECSHLFCPVISKPEAAILCLKKLCDEMERRFALLSKYRVANLEAYNALRVSKESIMPEMPYLVCVIDEFADLMMVGGKEVSMYVQRIGQKARAAGIHLIIATQRPSKDNVPMMIKANVPCRIGLSCSSQVDSRVILDENGAETLLGKGDLLFKNPAKKSLIRAQSPFLSDDEIDRVLAYVKEKAGDPVYDREFIELEEIEDSAPQIDEDPGKHLYDEVKDFVLHTGITSKESIMRNFQLSSAKADSFLQAMASEQILMLGYEGSYVIGPVGQSIIEESIIGENK